MKLSNFYNRKFFPSAALGLAMVLTVIYLCRRHLGLQPIIFADEWIYSSLARLTPLGQVTIPSYLYFWVFGLTSWIGERFLDLSRLLNIFFFVASAPFIYLCARRVTGPKVASLIACVCLASPSNSYTAYFMPESMYFCMFWIFTWVALTKTHLELRTYAALTGTILGVMALVKVHALFLVPALCIFVAYIGTLGRLRERWVLKTSVAAVIAFLAVFLVKFGVGYCLAGENGLQLLGRFYGTQASNSVKNSFILAKLIPVALTSLSGHMMGLALVFGLPLAMLTYGVANRKMRASASPELLTVQIYTMLMLGASIGLAVAYTASIADFGPVEGVRLHFRYYDFCFPLLLFIAGSTIHEQEYKRLSKQRWLIAAIFGGAMVAAMVLLTRKYFLTVVDAPELIWLKDSLHLPKLRFLLQIIPLTGAAALILWAMNKKIAGSIYLFIFFPTYLLATDGSIRWHMQGAAVASPFDEAGQFIRTYLTVEERKHLTIAGTDMGELLRAKFHADTKEVEIINLDEKSPLNISQIPIKRRWLLVIGDHALPPRILPSLSAKSYSLIDLRSLHRPVIGIKLNAEFDEAAVFPPEGFWPAEPWGRWTSSKRATLRFKSPLPKLLNIVLRAQSFGPNAEQFYQLSVGDSIAKFRVATVPEDVFLQLETDGKQDSITITIPQPVSPKELGLNTDERTLGLGLISLEIGTRN